MDLGTQRVEKNKLDKQNSASLYKLPGKDCNGSGSGIRTVIGCKDFGGALGSPSGNPRAQENTTGSRHKPRWILQGET